MTVSAMNNMASLDNRYAGTAAAKPQKRNVRVCVNVGDKSEVFTGDVEVTISDTGMLQVDDYALRDIDGGSTIVAAFAPGEWKSVLVVRL